MRLPTAGSRKWVIHAPVLLFSLILMFTCGVSTVLSDEILEEEIDIEEILSDVSPGIDPRTATAGQMASLPFWDTETAGWFAAFRDSVSASGRLFKNPDDIPALNSIQRAILTALMENLSVPVAHPSVMVRSGMVVTPGETVSGAKYYTSLKFFAGERAEIVLLGERDPFEPRALDYTSGSVVVRSANRDATLIFGDFRPGFDQGLVWSRYSRTYTGGTAVQKSAPNRMENTSREETLFLRGTMFSLKCGKYGFSVWASGRDLDAALDDSGKAVTLRITGLHTGCARGNLSERIGGIRASVGTSKGSLSLTASAARYDPPLSRKPGESSLHDPASDSFGYVSAAGTRSFDAGTFFFEGAVMNEGEHAAIAGAVLQKGNGRTALVVRDYSAGYWAPRASAVSASGGVSNERGIYAAYGAALSGSVRIDASLDVSRTPERTVLSPMPLSRRTSLVVLEKQFAQKISGAVSWRTRCDSDEDTGRWSISGKMEAASGRHGWGGRSLAAWSGGGGEGGPYAETGIRRTGKYGSIDLTAGVFRIPSYDARFYRYERNVPGQGFSTAVWGNGASFTIVGTYAPLSVRCRLCDSDLMSQTREITLQGDFAF